MSLTPEEIERVAQLAALAVERESLPALAEQIGRILEYVSQLEAVPDLGEQRAIDYPGPRPRLRDDVPHRTPLAIPLEQIAPLFRDGLFLVPRLGAVGSDNDGAVSEHGE